MAMGGQNLRFTPVHVLFPLVFVFFVLHVPVGALDIDPCAIAECGEGTCIPFKGILGFDCDCYPGWRQYKFDGFTFPPCIIPNCTVNTGSCGDSSNTPPPAPSAPPPPPPPPPDYNPFHPCNIYIWCGDGTCVANGTDYYCQCPEGSFNVLDQTYFACFKPCAFGADCTGVSLGPHFTPPPPSPSSSNGTLAVPPPLPPGPPPKGSNNVSKCSKNYQVVNHVVLLAAVILAFFL